jgi:hypothetical protein
VIYIWVRRTLDWSDEETFWAQIQDRDRPGAEAWNSAFNIPFHRFRQRVAEIAAQNRAQVHGVARADWDEIPDGELVLPIDDDDWFAPEVATTLVANLDADAIGCRWPNAWVEVPLNRRHGLRLLAHRRLGVPLKFFCGTNNYALVKRPGNRDLLRNHVEAGRWFKARMKEPGAGGLRRLDARLSLANRTLASATVLREVGRPADLLRKLDPYRRLYRRKLGAEYAWAQPYLARMAELMDELEARRS